MKPLLRLLAVCFGIATSAAQAAALPTPTTAPSSATEITAPLLGAQQPMPPAVLEGFVDGLVHTAMDNYHIAGVTISVVQDGAVVLKKGYGFAAFTPARRVDPDTTLFRIGSITKTFTWIGVMKAVEAGRMDLDQSINTYLPPEIQVPSEGYAPIKLRDLLTHSPGFEDHALGVLFIKDPGRILALYEALRVHRPHRVRAPGVYSSYSNYGVALAGAALAHVERAPWQDIVEREILVPLAMAHTTPREPYPARAGLPSPMATGLAQDLSKPFRWQAGAYQPRDFEYLSSIAPAGSISSTASDMARYMLMLLGDGVGNGVTVFGPATAQAFRTPMTKLPRSSGAIAGGFFEAPLPGGFRGYGHDGGTLSFFSNMTVIPDLRLGVFVSTNTEGGAVLSGTVASRIVEHFYAPPRPAPATPPAGFATGRLAYAGTYIPTRRAYGGLEGFIMRLRPGLAITPTPDGGLLAGLGALQIRLMPTEDPSVLRVIGLPGSLAFEMAGGKAVRMLAPGGTYERASPLDSPQTLVMVALAAILAAVLAIAGTFVRLGRALPATGPQRIAGLVQIAGAIAWLLAIGVLVSWLAAATTDQATIIYDFPGSMGFAFSYAAIAASAIAAIGVIMLPFVWSGGGGWSGWRKLRYTLTALWFIALAALLGFWGALNPWY